MDHNRTNDRNDAKVRNLDDAAQNRELTEAELDFVSGGIVVTKQLDVTSTHLLQETVNFGPQKVAPGTA
jgi:hypothetical protein